MSTETRLNQVERDLERMALRLRHVEAEIREEAPRPAPPSRGAPPPPVTVGPGYEFKRPAPPRPAPAPAQPVSPVSGASFEEIFGGRVLAWIGALAILLGAALFMGMAISRGWLDEEARTVIGALGSLGLLLGGVWLHERKGRTEAARAAVASAISGLYVTLLVAAQAYELISPELGLVLAAPIAAVGVVIAVRWSSPVVAAVGVLGALAAPILVGMWGTDLSIAFVAVALVATVGILLWQRWGWLALGAFAISAPQVLAWIMYQTFDGGSLEPFTAIPVLLGFWALYLAAAFGFEIRTRAAGALPVASLLLLFASSALVVSCGYGVFSQAGDDTGAVIWLFGFAATHVALGALSLRGGLHRETGALLIGVGIALLALGLAEALDGPGLVISWAAMSVALAMAATRVDASPDPAFSSAERLLGAAAGFLGLALVHTLTVEAPPSVLFEGVENLGAAVAAVAACATAALAFRQLVARISPEGAIAAGVAGATSLVYLGSVLIVDAVGVNVVGEANQTAQVWLSAFWTVTGLGAVIWGLVRKSASVRLGGLALLGVAIVKVWTYDLSELDELARVLSFVGLGLLLLVGAFAYQRIKPGEKEVSRSAGANPGSR